MRTQAIVSMIHLKDAPSDRTCCDFEEICVEFGLEYMMAVCLIGDNTVRKALSFGGNCLVRNAVSLFLNK